MFRMHGTTTLLLRLLLIVTIPLITRSLESVETGSQKLRKQNSRLAVFTKK